MQQYPSSPAYSILCYHLSPLFFLFTMRSLHQPGIHRGLKAVLQLCCKVTHNLWARDLQHTRVSNSYTGRDLERAWAAWLFCVRKTYFDSCRFKEDVTAVIRFRETLYSFLLNNGRVFSRSLSTSHASLTNDLKASSPAFANTLEKNPASSSVSLPRSEHSSLLQCKECGGRVEGPSGRHVSS